MLGNVEVAEQKGLTSMSQRAASAWASAFEGNGIVGASYKPLLYVGTQIVRGVNHIFIAEQTLVLAQPVRHIVVVKINEFDGNYTTVGIDQLF